MLVGCGSGGGGGVDAPNGDAVGVDAGAPDARETGFRVGGTVLGLRVPRPIEIVADGSLQRILLTEDGPFYLPDRVADGASYEATLQAGDQPCVLDPTGASGTVAGADATSIRVTCDGVVELRSLGFSIPAVLGPAFDPEVETYAASRPLLLDPAGTFTVTPVASYPADSAITVNAMPTPSGAPSSPFPVGDPTPPFRVRVQMTHAAFPPRAYTVDVEGRMLQGPYLKASNTAAGDRFAEVAMSGDAIAVGAPLEGADSSGAVYVYRQQGAWAFEKHVEPANNAANDLFGAAVALDGTTLAVGAPSRDGAFADTGAVYVFRYDGVDWVQEAYLEASNAGANDQFGASVALAGDTLVVGAPFEDSNATGVGGDQTNNAATNAGAAYVFVRSGSTWTQQAYAKASDTASASNFGAAVTASGERIAVGAPAAASGRGAAYVFERTGTSWLAPIRLMASNAEILDAFGTALALSSTVLVVGAPGEDSDATGVDGPQGNNNAGDSGASYVFRFASTWTQEGYLKPTNTAGGWDFGRAVAIDGANVIVGAPGEGGAAAVSSGAIYPLQWTPAGGWRHLGRKKALHPDPGDEFGSRVALDGYTAVIGAPGEDSAATGPYSDELDNSALNAGAAFVLR